MARLFKRTAICQYHLKGGTMQYKKNQKLEALLATANAYKVRGAMIQYDQSRLDPNHITISRRDYYAAPEEATEQKTIHLDCSGFVFAVFYQAFGYEFEADLTFDMIALKDIRAFYYEVTGKETQADRQAVLSSFRSVLQPGDVVIFEYGGNGHAMLYAGGTTLLHCVSLGDTDSYRYATQHDTFYAQGAIFDLDLSALTEPAPGGIRSMFYLFQDTCFRFCILRPLEKIDRIRKDAHRRSDPASHLQDIAIQILTSHPEGRSAATGDDISYMAKVQNKGRCSVPVALTFEAPPGTSSRSGNDVVLQIPPGCVSCASWCVRVEDDNISQLQAPRIWANEMNVSAPAVLCGKNLSAEECEQMLAAALQVGDCAEDGLAAIKAVYPRDLPKEFVCAGSVIDALFITVDRPNGMALMRKGGSWAEDLLLPAHFGGMSVISQERNSPESRKHRIRDITPLSLQAGDILVYCDDLEAAQAYACVCLREQALYGKFEPGQPVGSMEGEEMCSWIGKLLGRNCFVVLRPSRAK